MNRVAGVAELIRNYVGLNLSYQSLSYKYLVQTRLVPTALHKSKLVEDIRGVICKYEKKQQDAKEE